MRQKVGLDPGVRKSEAIDRKGSPRNAFVRRNSHGTVGAFCGTPARSFILHTYQTTHHKRPNALNTQRNSPSWMYSCLRSVHGNLRGAVRRTSTIHKTPKPRNIGVREWYTQMLKSSPLRENRSGCLTTDVAGSSTVFGARNSNAGTLQGTEAWYPAALCTVKSLERSQYPGRLNVLRFLQGRHCYHSCPSNITTCTVKSAGLAGGRASCVHSTLNRSVIASPVVSVVTSSRGDACS